MKRFLPLLFLIALTVAKESLTFAQTSEIDSLLNVLESAKQDTNTINALNLLSEKVGWRVGNYDTAFHYAERAKLLSKELNFKKGIADASNNLGNICLLQSDYSEALKNHLASLNIREQIEDKSGIAKSYNNIGSICFEQGKYSEARKNHLSSLAISKEIGDSVGVSKSYLNIGNIHLLEGNLMESMKNYLSALRISKEIGDKPRAAIAYSSIGMVYENQADYPKSLENYLASLRIQEELGDKVGIAKNHSKIGILHFHQEDYAKAMESYSMYLKACKELGFQRGIAEAYGNIGMLKNKQGDFSEALQNHLTSLEINEKIGYTRGVANSYYQIASAYFNQGNYSKALQYFFSSLKITEELQDVRGIASAYGNIGATYIALNDRVEGRRYLTEGLDLAIENGLRENAQNRYLDLSILDSTEGDFVEAFGNYKLYIQYRDSLFNEKNIRKTTQLEMQYQFDKKEAIARIEQEKKDAVAAEKLERKNQQRNAFIAGFILMIGLAGISFRSYQVKKRDNGIITAQKQQVEHKNEEIMASINYAKKLQTAVLPPARVVKEFFADSFLLYLPRDIVSGDFYWMESKGEVSYFAVADCTGHGVPGAMLSVIGMNGLNRALNERKLTEPKDILTSLSEHVQRHFEQSESTVRDGMDICLCALDTKTKKLTYAGANNPVWIARAGQMHILKPDRRAIGHHNTDTQFTQQEFQLHDGDTIYLSSDGYQDQLGGSKGYKLMTKVFREKLLVLSTKPLDKQRQTLLADLETWRGNHHQTDDICVMGVRV